MELPSRADQVIVLCPCLRVHFTENVRRRHDRLSRRWFQRCQDARCSAQQAAGRRTPHGLPPLPYFPSQKYEFTVAHKQAHALTPILTCTSNPPEFPFLTLLVSGGHTLLLLATSTTQFRVLATTPDESVGRVFDKVSRLLALPWSAKGPGASLEEFVAASPVEDNLAPSMPRTMPGTLGFSFTGLHSAVERFVTARGGGAALDEATKRAVADAFQTAAVNQLEEKVALGLKWCRDRGHGVKHLVVSGGVASNSHLRNRYV
jgi:N6-L-threonylcarbamoyladenine synthase